MYPITFYLIATCLSHFPWTISLPSPSIRIGDRTSESKRCINLHWASCHLLTRLFLLSGGRYNIVEDIDPQNSPSRIIDSFILFRLPITVATFIRSVSTVVLATTFGVQDIHRHPTFQPHAYQQQRQLSNAHLYKYIYFCIPSICDMLYDMISVLAGYIIKALWQDEGLRP